MDCGTDRRSVRDASGSKISARTKELKSIQEKFERIDELSKVNEKLKHKLKEENRGEQEKSADQREKEAIITAGERDREIKKLKQELSTMESEISQSKQQTNEINTQRRGNEKAKLLTTLDSLGKKEADASALISAQLQTYQKEKKDLADQYKNTMQSLRDELSNKDILLSEIDNKVCCFFFFFYLKKNYLFFAFFNNNNNLIKREDVAEAKRLREENDTLQVQMETLNNEMQD
ncbi:hypothetical protein RFI_27547, partial [Reticulomyxa filosa]